MAASACIAGALLADGRASRRRGAVLVGAYAVAVVAFLVFG